MPDDEAVEEEEQIFQYEVAGDELTLNIDNAIILLSVVEDADYEYGLDPEDLGIGDLDLDDEDLEITDDELADVLEVFVIYALAEQFDVVLEELDLEEDADFGDVVSAMTEYLIIVQLEEELGVDFDDDFDPSLGDDPDFEALLDTIVESFGVPAEDVEAVDVEELEQFVEDLHELTDLLDEQLSSLGEGLFVRSDRPVVTPPGRYTLSNGITAVQQRSWGQVKESFMR